MPSETFWNILEHSGTFCMHSVLTRCNILEHSACILELSACILEHSETFWNILHAFWKILHVFWNILEHSGTVHYYIECCKKLEFQLGTHTYTHTHAHTNTYIHT